MTRAIKTMLLFAGVLVLAAGCGKDVFHRSGDSIVFSVGTNAETRTVYGDITTSGTQKIQAINWVAGDMIRIYSPNTKRNAWKGYDQQWADYTVTPTTANASKGTLSNVQPFGLSWTSNGDYTFYSVYPSPQSDEEDAPTDGISGKFSLSIPAAQTPATLMDHAFMTAAAQVTTTDSDNVVNLDFYPAFTGFDFELTGEDQAVTLNEISIESASGALTGAFTVDYNGTATASYDATGTGKKVTLTLPENTVLTKTTPLTCTVITLPVEVTDLTLSIVRTFDGSQVTNSLELKRVNGTFLTFAARRKHRLTGIVTPIMVQLTTFDATTGSWQTWTHNNTVLGN